MSFNVGTAEAVLRLRDEYSAEFKKFSDQLNKGEKTAKSVAREIDKLESEYKQLTAALDPATARQLKYDRAVDTLNKSLKAGIITQQQYNAQLVKSQVLLQSTTHWTSRLGSSIGSELTGNFARFIGTAALVSGALGAIASITKQLFTVNIEAETSTRKVEAAIKLHGATVGITTREITRHADQISRLTGLDDELIAETEASGLKFNRLGKEILPLVTEAAIDMAAKTGIDIPAAMEKAGRYVNQPLKALTLLTREGYAVGASQSDLIKKLLAANDVLGAQKEVLKILQAQYGGTAAEMRDSMGGALTALSTSWENFLEALGEDSTGPLRRGIESLISLLEMATDRVGYLGVGFLDARIKVNSFVATALDGIADIIDAIQKAAPAFGVFGIALKTIGSEVPERLRRGAGVAADTVTKDMLELADALADLETGHKRAGKGVLELTDAERKLAEEIAQLNQKVQDLLDKFRLQAEGAEALAIAHSKGAAAVRIQTEENQRAATIASSIKDLDKLSAEAKLKLAESIGAYIDRLNQANLAGKANQETLSQQQKTISDLGALESEISDIRTRSTLASREFARTQEIVNAALKLQVDINDPLLDQIKEEINLRYARIAALQAEIAIEKHVNNLNDELAKLYAELSDAINQTTQASYDYQTALRARNLVESAGLKLGDSGNILLNRIVASMAARVKAEEDLKRGIEARTEAQIAANEADADLANRKAEFTDYQKLIAVSKQYGSEIASILDQYGLLSQASKERYIQEQALVQFQKENGARTLAEITAEIRSQQSAVDELAQAWASFDIKLWVQQPFEEAFESIKSSFISTVNDMVLSGSASWDDFWDSFKRLALEAIEEWLKRFIASHRIAQAEAARTAAINAASAGAGGAGAAGAGASGAGAGNLGALAAGSGGASAWSTYGTYASYAFFAWVGYNIYKGFTKKRPFFGEASLGGGRAGSIKISDQLGKVIEQITKELSDLLAQWDLGIEHLGDITIGQTSKGTIYVKTIIDSVGKVFSTMEEAIEYAKLQAIKFAEFSASTSELIRAAIRGSDAETLSGLQGDIDFARMIENLGIPELEQQIRSMVDTLVRNVHRIFDLFGRDLPQAAVAVNAVLTDFSSNIWDLYNNLSGIKEDPKQKWERDKLVYAAQRAVMEAQITLLIEEVRARILAYQAHRLTIFGGGGGGEIPSGGWGTGGGTGRGNVTDSGGGGRGEGARGGNKGGWQPGSPQPTAPDARNPGNDPQLAALLQILDNLTRVLSGLPPANITAGFPGVGRGGGVGASNRQSVRDFIADKKFELSLVGLSDYRRSLAELDKQYDELLEKAGRDQKLRQELLALRAQEIALLEKEQAARTIESFQSFLGLITPFDEIRKTAQGLIDDINDSPFGDARKAAMIGRVMAEVDRQIEKLSRESAAGLFGEMIADLEKYGVTDQELSEARRAMAILEHVLKMEHYRTEIAILKEKGKLDDKTLQTLEGLLGRLEGIGLDVVGNSAVEYTGPRFKGYDDPVTSASNNLADNLNRLAEAFADAKEDIRDLLNDIARGDLGIVSPKAGFDAARQQYLDVLDKAKRSELTGFEDAAGVARNYIEALKSYSPELASVELPRIQDDLNLLLKATTVRDENLVYSEKFVANQDKTNTILENGIADLSSTANLSNMIQRNMLDRLDTMNSYQLDLNNRLARLESGGLGQKR